MPRLFRLPLVLFFAALIWAGHYDRFNPANWQFPVAYGGDAIEMLAEIRALAEGGPAFLWRKHVERLGAPFGADWRAYPLSDPIVFLLVGLVAKIIGLIPASNLALLGAHLASASSFYAVSRWLRHRWLWSAAGALLFSFTFLHLQRNLTHFALTLSFTLPPALLACALVVRGRRLYPGSSERRWCWGAAALLGVSNPYHLFLFFQLLAGSILIRAARDRWQVTEGVRVGLFAFAIAGGGFAVVQAAALVSGSFGAEPPAVHRTYGGSEKYALKPVELFLPPPNHRTEAGSFLGHRYDRWALVKGEPFSPYLGLVAGGGLLWLLGGAAWRLVSGRGSRGSSPAPAALWILAFSTIGGVNNAFALITGLHLFRATNRYSIWLAAIALLFLMGRLNRLSFRWPRLPVCIAAAGIALVGLLDQIPATSATYREWVKDTIEADRDFGLRLEAALPPGAVLFQLPLVDFPEAVPPLEMQDYEHLRPYIFSRTLRFSHGSLRGQAESAWMDDLAAIPPGDLLPELESLGVNAVYWNHRGMEDGGLDLIQTAESRERGPVLVNALADQGVIVLRPTEDPKPPLARFATFGRNWHPWEDENERPHRWTYGRATLSFHNPHPAGRLFDLEFEIAGETERDASLRVDGIEVWRGVVEPEFKPVLIEGIRFRSGRVFITLESSRPPVRSTTARYGLRSLALTPVEVRPAVE